MIIRAIVYAKDKDEALQKAYGIFEGMCGEGRDFDYYRMFRKEDAGTGVSGSDRWGELPAVSEVTSKEGKKLVDEGIKYTKQRFMEAIKKVREGIEKYTDDELFEEKDRLDIMFKYYCNCIGQYSGPEIFLYDDDGSGIRSERELKDALNQYGKPNKELKVYVVPADVHH